MAKEKDWRKVKRHRNGSIKTIKGILYARIQYIDETGKRREKLRRANSRTHANELIKQMREELQSSQATLEADKLNFHQLAESYQKAKLVAPVYVGDRKVAGLRSFRQTGEHLKPSVQYFARKIVRQITVGDIQKYKLHRLTTPIKSGGQRAIASVNRELALLRSIFNYAKSESLILRSPFEQSVPIISMADEKKRERVLSLSEEKRLLAACSDQRSISYIRNGKHITVATKAAPYLKSVIILALDTGIRKCEILKLKWQNVDFVMNEITILAFNTKTGSKRTVGMTSRVRDELNKLWKLLPKRKDNLVFGIADFKRSFATAIRAADINDLHFHDLRHTAITRMVASGLPVPEIMKISGHTQMSTFQRYVDPDNDTTQRHPNVLELYLAANQPQENAENNRETVN